MVTKNKIFAKSNDEFYYEGTPKLNKSDNISFEEISNEEVADVSTNNGYLNELSDTALNIIVFKYISIVIGLILIIKALSNYIKNTKIEKQENSNLVQKPIIRYVIMATILMIVSVIMQIIFSS